MRGLTLRLARRCTLIAAEISAETLIERKTLDRQLQQKSNQPFQDTPRILNFSGMSIASSVVNQQNTMGARKALKLSQ
jgi:DNA-binding phage protein